MFAGVQALHLRHAALRTAGAELTAAGTWNVKHPLREVDLTVEFHTTDLSVLLPATSRIPTLRVPAKLTGHFCFDDRSSQASEITLRELASSANGTLDWHGSKGRLYQGEGGFLFSDLAMLVIPQVLSPCDPISQFSQQCGVVALKIKADVAEAEVAVLQTKTLGIISTGRVDLATEAIDFGFRTKQLSGLGFSVGAVLTPNVRVSGTLANPTWRPDVIAGVVTGGAAILSRGLSVLAKGVWDRYLSSGDVCDAALKQAGLESSFSAWGHDAVNT